MGNATRSATVLALSTLLAASAVNAHAKTYAAWIQIGPGGYEAGSATATTAAQAFNAAGALSGTTILARAITDPTDPCPALQIDAAPSPAPMHLRFRNANPPATSDEPRAAQGKARFPVQECEAIIPPGHTTATVGDVPLKLPVPNPQRIIVFGDSGCRMKGKAQQNCHDPETFPLEALAGIEAAMQPDLVIHVGDYFYRDSDCDDAFPGCNLPGSATYEPWGDDWESWNLDFITPARKLLAAAPWIMVRGNHESCGRGAQGWYALLDPHPFNPNAVACRAGAFDAESSGPWGFDFEPSYVAPLGNLRLIVHDSSYADDEAVAPAVAARYADDLKAVLASINGAPAIYITHRPIFGMVRGHPTDAGNATQQAMFFGGLLDGRKVPPNIGLFLTGHIHQFQYFNFQDADTYPPQMIVGTGGDRLDDEIVPGRTTFTYANRDFTLHLSPTTTAIATVERAFAQAEFGFALLRPSPTGYNVDVYTRAGLAGTCAITLGPAFATGTSRGITCAERPMGRQ